MMHAINMLKTFIQRLSNKVLSNDPAEGQEEADATHCMDSTSQGMKCPVCESISLEVSALKYQSQYWKCKVCEAVFLENLNLDIIQTHNNDPESRAVKAVQAVRVQRMVEQLGRQPVNILDFGCGKGDFVKFLKEYGFQAWGVDQDSPMKLTDFSPQSLDAINMVEVIEHLPDPTGVFRQLKKLLRVGGIIYIESSFVDFIGDPETSDYVDPRIGHCCIHSQKSVDYLCAKLDMSYIWINQNVVVMHKRN